MKPLLFLPAVLSTAALSLDLPRRGRSTPERLGTYRNGPFDESAAETAVHDLRSQRLFVVNAQAATLDVLDRRPAARRRRRKQQLDEQRPRGASRQRAGFASA